MWNIPLFDTSFDSKELDAVQNIMLSGWLTMGRVTQELERLFSEFIGVKHAIAVSSCTAGLTLINMAIGIQEGDEIICPSLTFVAGANTILSEKGIPIFVDIKSQFDLNISSKSIEQRITSKTKAIQVMHYAGYPCDMDEIMEIAKKKNIYVIEDCAHAPGAEYQKKKCGAIGHLGVFSFFSNKNMTTGEGGMVTTNDDEFASKIKLLRSHGMTSLTLDRHQGHCFSYDVLEAGHNFRIDEIRSAIGIVQLKKLNGNNKSRQKINDMYRKLLADVEELDIPFASVNGKSAYHIFPVILKKDVDRQNFMEHLKGRGIQTSIHYPPIHKFEFYKKRFLQNKENLSVTEDVAGREVTLPLYPTMSEGDVICVCDTIKKYFKKE